MGLTPRHYPQCGDSESGGDYLSATVKSSARGDGQLFLNVGESGYGRCPKDGGV